MKFEKYYKGFQEYLITKNYAKHTQTNYMQHVRVFLQFLADHYPGVKHLSQITKAAVYDFQKYLQTKKNTKNKFYAVKTINKFIISLNRFFKYLMIYDFVIKNPVEHIDRGREEKSHPRAILSEAEINMILTSIKLDSPESYRNKAMIEIFYSCGLRTFELVNLKVSDIDFQSQVIVIRKGKYSKSRVVPMTQYCSEYVQLYLDKARKFFVSGSHDDGALFYMGYGIKLDVSNINRNIMRKIIANTPIKKHVTCYTFRHSVATMLVKNNVDIRYVAELLGHSSLETTQQYTHIAIKDLKKMHSLHHPRDKANCDPENKDG